VIGSQALNIVAPQLARTPKDYDLVGTYDEIQDFLKRHRSQFRQIYPINQGKKIVAKGKDIFEFEIAWSDSAIAKYASAAPGRTTRVLDEQMAVADADLLFTLKKTHRYLKNSPHFLKTMTDYRALREWGAKVVDEEFFRLREKETYNYAHPKLNVMKDEFFSGNGLVQQFDHDTIHLSVAAMEKPAYEYYKSPDAQVMCDKNLFFSVPEEVRLNGVLEEALVLALERSQVPFKGLCSARKSFEFALIKVATSITSGWFREYAYENYHTVMGLYRDNYVEKFWQDVEKGLVVRL